MSFSLKLKTTLGFASSQIFTIISGIIKNKIIAYYFGASGIGIVGVLSNAQSLIGTVLLLGLDRSGVKLISAEQNVEVKNHYAAQFFKYILVNILILVPFAFILWFYGVSFFNGLGTSEFVLLLGSGINFSITTLILAVYRSRREVRKQIYMSIINAYVSSLVLVSFLMLLGLKSIYFGLFISTFLVLLLFSVKLMKDGLVSVLAKNRVVIDVQKLYGLGISMMIAGVITMVLDIQGKLLILKLSGEEVLGYATVFFTFLSVYFGMFFTAIVTDFYPELASKVKVRNQRDVLINEQVKSTLFMLSIAIVFFVHLLHFGIKLLYSSEFLFLEDFILLGLFGIVFKGIAYPVGVIFAAEDNARSIILSEIIFSVTSYGVLFFYFNVAGINAVLYSFLTGNLLQMIFTLVTAVYKHRLKLENRTYSVIILAILHLFFLLMVKHKMVSYFFSVVNVGLVFLMYRYTVTDEK